MRRIDVSWLEVLPEWTDHDLDCLEADIRSERNRRKSDWISKLQNRKWIVK